MGLLILMVLLFRHRRYQRSQCLIYLLCCGGYHARWAAKEYPIYAQLAEAAKDQWLSAYNFAISDFYEAPVIHRIEHRDGSILVEATDNVMVSQVRLTILDEAGKPLEFVDGARGEGDWWEFNPQVEGTKIVAQAWDLANNRAKFQLTL